MAAMLHDEQAIFEVARKIGSGEAREAYLRQICADDAAIGQRVRDLLKAYEDSASFLETPVVERPGTEVKDQAPGSSTQAYSSIDTNESASLEFLTPSAKPDVLGRLGHYEILEVIGRGGMGIVLRAFDEQLHRVVAIKVMTAQLATNATARRRFAREAQAAAAVSHDHVVTIHAVEEAAPLPYLVMQYVAGLSLQQRLDRDGPLELPEILRIGVQTAAGLAAAHAHGLIHRDIKPANILLENGVERVKVTDFGLARAVADASLTQSGFVAGTPQYMSPEQARGEGVDQRTDLFSLGSVMYAMCTGRAPFRASGAMAVLKRVCEETPTPIRETNSEIPDWLVAIIDKLHAKDPAKRYQSAAEVAELLARHLAQVQQPLLSPQSLAQPRRRLVLAAAVLLCFVAGMSLTEAAGVTHLRAALVRIFTPEGMPVVKTDDPDVNVENGAFVLLAGKKERRFDTLAEAVQGASNGDTIEIRGNGPFVSQPINLAGTALTIRAAERFRPAFQLQPRSPEDTAPFLTTDAPLVLEGLELRGDHPSMPGMLNSRAPLYLANCRLISNNEGKRRGPLVLAHNAPLVELRNCEFLGQDNPAAAVRWNVPPTGRLSMENCCGIDGRVLRVSILNHDPKDISIHLARNTWSTKWTTLMLAQERPVTVPPATADYRLIRWNTVDNVFDGEHSLLSFDQARESVVKIGAPPPLDAEALLARMVNWQEKKNAYSVSGLSIWSVAALEPTGGLKDLAAWDHFWKLTGTGSVEGRARFQGGNLRARTLTAPENVGPDDFRLRPDSAGYRAGKDGKDLGADVDLVGPGAAYDRWKKTPEYQQWLKDTKQVTKAQASKAEPKAFVVLGGKSVAERKFDTLVEAVQSASDGDTIEIRGNGPFVTQPVSFGRRSLTIRAAAGFRPVIKGTVGQVLRSQGPLVLEGLELHMTGPLGSKTVHSEQGPLHVVNCRFVLNGSHSIAVGAPVCTVRNCEFVGALNGGHHVVANLSNNGKMILENNLFSGPSQHALDLVWERRNLQHVAIHMNHNTVATRNASIVHGLIIVPESAEQDAAPDRPSVQMHVSANLFDPIDPTGCTFSLLLPPDWYRKEAKPLSVEDAERLLPRLMAWREERNLYRKGLTIQTMRRNKSPIGQERAEVDEPLPVGRTLADWQRLWKTGDSGSMQGVIRYEGGDVLAKMAATPEQITAEDFRLRPDSAGFRAGKDGKDLGADVDLVGPGPAYERWKKTPEYQQWLKDTGQLRAEAPKPESMAFMVVGGKGIEVGKYDTLAEAVVSASDGDAIEVRGDGPFVTEPVSFGKRSLTIRAAAGFRPVIKGNAGRIGEGVPYLLHSQGSLVLEGLELHMTGAFNSRIVSSEVGPLHVANCRFVLSGFHSVSAADTLVCTVRNCEFVGTSGGARHHVISNLRNDGKLTLENNLLSSPGGNSFGIFMGRPGLHNLAIRLKHNTVVTPSVPIIHGLMFVPESAEPDAPPGRQPVQVNVSETLFELTGVQERIFSLLLCPDWYRKDAKPLSATEAEQLLPRLFGWREERNLYCKDLIFLAKRRMKDSIGPERAFVDEPLPAGRGFADWQRMWNTGDSVSVQGVIRYERGDVLAMMKATPELITAADFRLRPDSAGYRAGKDGKDLGADVDLVGPGPAYERWKKTPEYQQWLMDTKQARGP